MKRIFLFVIAFLVIASLMGCDTNDKNTTNLSDEGGQAIEFKLIASEKNLPSNFDDIAFERKETPHFQYLVKKVENQSEYEDMWNLYGFENEIPNVDFNKKATFFVGVHESGSCPYKINNVELSSDNKTMTLPLKEPGGACNSDATPRTFVIQIDKEISKEIGNVVIVQSRVGTNVPFES
ncbi:hypothetical protein F7731_12080 [Cytobacillus depressus]|uniref:Lipoprotein n=1 Tax=Cytobacillus depressus TaxID=1602942 RepID=A0A6L3VAU9_9BACI|nr:hypothetical protein [Cytobacillus depressus]KAB2336228.1 hypothetical protein F7731_12080 [Cytobacillus depressus]